MALFFVLFLASCGTKLVLPAEETKPDYSAAELNGQEVFMKNCNRCHPAGNAGLGPSIINKPLPGFLLKLQVRKGFGTMPAFDREHLPEKELDDLVSYIKAVRK